MNALRCDSRTAGRFVSRRLTPGQCGPVPAGPTEPWWQWLPRPQALRLWDQGPKPCGPGEALFSRKGLQSVAIVRVADSF